MNAVLKENRAEPLIINIKATNEMFTEKCISRSAWATKNGLNPNVFSQRLNGHLAITPEIAALLRKDGLLVEDN